MELHTWSLQDPDAQAAVISTCLLQAGEANERATALLNATYINGMTRQYNLMDAWKAAREVLEKNDTGRWRKLDPLRQQTVYAELDRIGSELSATLAGSKTYWARRDWNEVTTALERRILAYSTAVRVLEDAAL